ncbi:MAG: zinc-ribbon domain-containing protein [Isosphaerales bacterium]
MALINCPECKREVSDNALSCPQCGYPIAAGAKRDSAPDPPLEKSHTIHQEVGTFGKSFGETTGKGFGCVAIAGIIFIVGIVLLFIPFVIWWIRT